MTTNVSTSGKHVIVINNRKLSFEQRVAEFRVVDDRVLVRLNSFDFPPDDQDGGRNIFAYDENANLTGANIDDRRGRHEDRSTAARRRENYVNTRSKRIGDGDAIAGGNRQVGVGSGVEKGRPALVRVELRTGETQDRLSPSIVCKIRADHTNERQ